MEKVILEKFVVREQQYEDVHVDLKNVAVYTPALASSLFKPALPAAVATTSAMSTVAKTTTMTMTRLIMEGWMRR